MKVINKIAFILHEPVMYDHYSSVWSKLHSGTFIIVLHGALSAKGNDANARASIVVNNLDKLGYKYTYFDDVLRSGHKYKYVVTNHFIGGSSMVGASLMVETLIRIKNYMKRILNLLVRIVGGHKQYTMGSIETIQYFPLQIGIKQIRFMYGADIGDGWSLQPWNELYDLFLCHGPNDENEIKKRFNKKTMVMGYPRYDEYFSADINTASVINEFGIDSSKKTILWMPTTGLGACSIPCFAEKISGLMKDYNVIVRPHPISFRTEPQYIELLKSLNYKIDSNSIRNMNELYKISDIVLCDFGGSAFSTIYLDKDLILLDVPETEECSWTENVSNYQLFKHVPVIKVDDFYHIHDLIADESQWIEWRRKRKNLFDIYFADNRGTSSLKAVEILNNLDEMIG